VPDPDVTSTVTVIDVPARVVMFPSIQLVEELTTRTLLPKTKAWFAVLVVKALAPVPIAREVVDVTPE
jgi:hypothetical protein